MAKNCENCSAAPAAWFCNSDGTPALFLRHLCLFSASHDFAKNLSPHASRVR
ncbi:hypothetical protein N9L76_01015 [bacterium]|nr:hypothetical protein [bacterium]